MFHRRRDPAFDDELIDLILDSDIQTRKLLIFRALQSGALRKSEAEQVLALVGRLERAAAGPSRDKHGSQSPAA